MGDDVARLLALRQLLTADVAVFVAVAVIGCSGTDDVHIRLDYWKYIFDIYSDAYVKNYCES